MEQMGSTSKIYPLFQRTGRFAGEEIKAVSAECELLLYVEQDYYRLEGCEEDPLWEPGKRFFPQAVKRLFH